MIAFNFITMCLAGNTGVAAYGVIANISIVVISIFTGVAQGIQPIISRLYGVGDRTSLAATLGYAMKAIVILSAAIYALVFFGADPIAAAFNDAQNVQMQNIATVGLKVYFISCVFAGFNIIVSAYFAATAHARPAYLITIWGMTGVWCSLPVAESLVSLIALALYYRKRFL